MADYSGYYECGECGAGGTYSKPPKHAPTCSAPERIARAERKRAQEKQDKAHAEDVLLDDWSKLSKEEAFDLMFEIGEKASALWEQYAILEKARQFGLTNIRKKDWTNDFLDQMRTNNARP